MGIIDRLKAATKRLEIFGPSAANFTDDEREFSAIDSTAIEATNHREKKKQRKHEKAGNSVQSLSRNQNEGSESNVAFTSFPAPSACRDTSDVFEFED